jgi:hypothetical protein
VCCCEKLRKSVLITPIEAMFKFLATRCLHIVKCKFFTAAAFFYVTQEAFKKLDLYKNLLASEVPTEKCGYLGTQMFKGKELVA